MLRGICDADLLLDSNFRICGDAAGLRRLLGCQDEVSGLQFQELIIGADARKRFAALLTESGLLLRNLT